MSGLILAAINLGIQGLTLANTITGRKHIDELEKLRLEILDEENRGYNSDDAKIETLYAQVKIALEASENEIKLKLASAASA